MKNPRLAITLITSLLDEAIIVAVILFALPRLGVHIPLWLTALIGVCFVIWAAFLYRMGSRVLGQKPVAGLTDMTGMEGKAAGALNPRGLVKIDGELWEARSEDGSIPRNSDIIVVSQDRLKLVVRPLTKSGPRSNV